MLYKWAALLLFFFVAPVALCSEEDLQDTSYLHGDNHPPVIVSFDTPAVIYQYDESESGTVTAMKVHMWIKGCLPGFHYLLSVADHARNSMDAAPQVWEQKLSVANTTSVRVEAVFAYPDAREAVHRLCIDVFDLDPSLSAAESRVGAKDVSIEAVRVIAPVPQDDASENAALRHRLEWLQKDRDRLVAEMEGLKMQHSQLQRIASYYERDAVQNVTLSPTACVGDSVTELSSIDVEAIQVVDSGRFSPQEPWEYSTIQCLGPAATGAVHARVEHPHATIAPERLRSGLESEDGGGFRQRVCRIRNACVTSGDPAVHLHLNPVMDTSHSFLKADADEALAGRFVQLDTHIDSMIEGAGENIVTFRVHHSSIRTRAPPARWYNGSFAYLQSFAAGNLGHAVFDDLFGSYMAFRQFGIDPRHDDVGILLNRDCAGKVCIRVFHDWARGMSDQTLHRPSLLGDAGDLHCFSDLIVGVGQFAAIAGTAVRKAHGKSATLRAFRRLVYHRLGVVLPARPAAPVHRVLINKKREGHRVVQNFEDIATAISTQLGLDVEFTPDNLFDLPAREQIQLLSDYTIVLTPVGTISMRLFFCRPGTSVVFLAHVMVFDDIFWNHVDHINDLYYIAQDDEVVEHSQLSPTEQWTADLTVDVPRLLPLVVTAAHHQERWRDMHAHSDHA